MIQEFHNQMMPAVYLLIAAVILLFLVIGTQRVWQHPPLGAATD